MNRSWVGKTTGEGRKKISHVCAHWTGLYDSIGADRLYFRYGYRNRFNADAAAFATAFRRGPRGRSVQRSSRRRGAVCQ